LLHIPFILAGLNMAVWLGITVLVTPFLSLLRDWGLHFSLYVIFRGLMIAIVAGVTAFFLVDGYSRKHVIPVFFPQGRLSDTPVRIKVSIIRRIRVLFGLGTNAPMLLLVGTMGFGVWQIGRVSAQAAAFGREMLVFAVVVWIIFICLALSLNFLVSSSISQPIREMLDQVGQIKKGDYQHRVPVVTNDELGVLGDGMNEMTEGLQEREHLRHSLILAKEIQQALLPADDPRVPGLDIAGSSIYCDDTGGDYYDYLLPANAGDPGIGIVLGDVSGHGISSALLMATSRGFLRQRAALPGTIEEIVADVNQQLLRDVGESGSFITMFYLQIDARGRRVSWVRAGHDPALLYDPDKDSFTELSGMGTVLGVDPDAVYREYHQADLDAGQIIVLGTDGIWEAQNPDGEMFGKKRLEQVVKRYRAAGARDILLAVLSAVDDFQNGRPAEDDITLIVIKLLEEARQPGGHAEP
jgi:sigma-B regulation protein RsbU (phosphoserine phosphatase)